MGMIGKSILLFAIGLFVVICITLLRLLLEDCYAVEIELQQVEGWQAEATQYEYRRSLFDDGNWLQARLHSHCMDQISSDVLFCDSPSTPKRSIRNSCLFSWPLWFHQMFYFVNNHPIFGKKESRKFNCGRDSGGCWEPHEGELYVWKSHKARTDYDAYLIYGERITSAQRI